MKDANSIKVPMDPKLWLEQSASTELGYSTAYALLIGLLMYVAIATHPDIAYTISWLASFMANPDMSHWMAAKQVLRYLAGTQGMGVRYTTNKSVPKPSTAFYAYADADFANLRDCVSMAGYAFLLNNRVITWSSKKQNEVMTSTAKAKYASIAPGDERSDLAMKPIFGIRVPTEGTNYHIQ